MSRQQNPFDPPQPLDSNPFDTSSAAHPQNPFTSQGNDSTFSLDSQDTARGLGRAPTTRSGATHEELEARERDLRAREEALRANEARLSGVQVNNWPPFFPFCHHDISSLPSNHQQVAKFLYFQWLALLVTLILNLVGCILLLISGSSEGGADTGASGGYIIFISVLSFVLWYRPIYLGFTRTEGRAMAFFFYIYFLFAGFHLLYSIYMVIGIPSTGSAGLINTIASFSQGHIVAGVFGLLASIGWVLQAAGGGILYKRVWDYKNGNGDITFQAATDQFKAASIKNIIMHQSRV